MKGNFNTAWTDEAVAVAKKYNDLQYSRGQIAVEIHRETGLHFTRNAVIGKLARLGVACTKPKSVRNHAVNRPARKPVNYLHVINSEKKAVLQRPAEARADPSDAIAMREQVKAVAAQAAPGSRDPLHIPFLERKDPECAFICSPDGEPVTVCGHTQLTFRLRGRDVQSSYCPAHHEHTHTGDFGLGRRRERRAA